MQISRNEVTKKVGLILSDKEAITLLSLVVAAAPYSENPAGSFVHDIKNAFDTFNIGTFYQRKRYGMRWMLVNHSRIEIRQDESNEL